MHCNAKKSSKIQTFGLSALGFEFCLKFMKILRLRYIVFVPSSDVFLIKINKILTIYFANYINR